MSTSQTVIALDIGHSAVKAMACASERRERVLFQSVVCPAIDISEEGSARAAALETVEVNGRKWFFGRTAALQGGAEVETGMSENWISDPAHLVLALGALKKLEAKSPPISAEGALVVVGLPAKLFAKQRSLLVDLLQPLMPGSTIKVFPQPLGPYLALQFNEQGQETTRRQRADEAWAIIEVGHFTTDFALLRGGDWIERGSGSCAGASSAIAHLQRSIESRTGHSITLLEASRAMENGSITLFGQQSDLTAEIEHAKQLFSDEVLPFAQRLWDREARTLNGVIVAGGGANLVRERVKAAFGSAIDAVERRFAVAEGFLRAGLAVSRAAQLRASRSAAA